MKNKLMIKNGIIIDGMGGEPYPGDILIAADKIAAVMKGPSAIDYDDAAVLDAGGRLVTPGFVDIHRHLDYAVLKDGFGAIELAQGITTAVSGSCGLTPFPRRQESGRQLDDLLASCLGGGVNKELFYHYRDYADHLRTIPLPINIGNLIGSCSVRIAVKGFAKTGFSMKELTEAKAMVADAMKAGALGLSMGIMYLPEYYSTQEELAAIAGEAARHGGILTCHIRGEGDSLVSSVEEITQIAKRAQIPLQISHFKSCGAHNWHREIHKAIEVIERARSAGMDIHVDFYPYTGGATTLLSLIPPDFLRSTLEETWDYMADAGAPAALKEALAKDHPGWDNYIVSLGMERILISQAALPQNQCYIGKTLAYIRDEGRDPYEFICSFLAEEQGRAGIIVMSMSQEDVDTVAKLPWSFVISDALYAEGGSPHPRLYAAFPRILRDFVMERRILTLPEAVRKMTAMPAEKMKLEGRGKIKENYFADLNIFDPEQVEDRSDFKHTGLLSKGMEQVLIGGQTVWQGERLISSDKGRLIIR